MTRYMYILWFYVLHICLCYFSDNLKYYNNLTAIYMHSLGWGRGRWVGLGWTAQELGVTRGQGNVISIIPTYVQVNEYLDMSGRT